MPLSNSPLAKGVGTRGCRGVVPLSKEPVRPEERQPLSPFKGGIGRIFIRGSGLESAMRHFYGIALGNGFTKGAYKFIEPSHPLVEEAPCMR